MKEDLIKESQSLYFDIDNCITELLRARGEHNTENEGKALFRMEGLMVATLQHLACIMEDVHSEKPNNLQEQPVDLEKEIKETFDKDITTLKSFGAYSRFARHFYALGRQSKEQPVCEGLHNAAVAYADKQTWDTKEWGDLKDRDECINDFIAGAKWQKEQDEREKQAKKFASSL